MTRTRTNQTSQTPEPETTTTTDSPETTKNEQKTVQTGQTAHDGPDIRRPYFEVVQNARGEWEWMLWSGNGRQMAMSVLTYKRRNDCTNAIENMMQIVAQTPKIVVEHQQ